MATDTVGAQQDSAKQSLSAIRILDELGDYIHRTSVLLQAAINTGAGEEEDESWLVGMAYEQMQECRRRYLELCGVGHKAPRS